MREGRRGHAGNSGKDNRCLNGSGSIGRAGFLFDTEGRYKVINPFEKARGGLGVFPGTVGEKSVSKRKKRRHLNERLAYIAVRLAACVFGSLPLGAAAALGRFLGRAYCRIDSRHRELSVTQMMNAYAGEISEEEARALTRAMYIHLGTMLAEFVRIPKLTKENIDRYVDWGNCLEKLKEVLAEGKGAILASGHIGNWEVSGAAFALKGINSGAVARPLDNPLLNTYVKRIRQHSGQKIWDKVGAVRRIVRVLKNRGGFGILVDQDAGQRGLFVPFFALEASTIPTHVDLALMDGAPIVTIGIHRVGRPMCFKVKMGPVRRPDPEAEKETERRRLLCLVNKDLEDIIRESPSQWLWIHRRWKTRPRTKG